MPTTLELVRQGVGIELRRGTFHILLDGRDVRSIEFGESVEEQVETGRHDLRIRAGRYSSQSHAFDAAEGEVVRFQCHGAMIWPRYVASIFKPDLAISLKRKSDG